MNRIVLTSAVLAVLVVAGVAPASAQSREPDREEKYCIYPRGGVAPDVGPYPCTRSGHLVGVRQVSQACIAGHCADRVNFGRIPGPSLAAAPGRTQPSLPAFRSNTSVQAP